MTAASSSKRTAARRSAGGRSRRRPVRGGAAHRRRIAARRRRWRIGLIVGGVVALVIGVGAFAVRTATLDQCSDETERYSAEQLANAQTIIAAGRDAGLEGRDQTIAVMTAMGESSLRNIDYGDAETSGVTNPDGTPTTSIGLFQQQDNWGSRDERLDPYTAASLFYRALVARVPDRDLLEPTIVAHRVQINRDPRHYERYWPRAEALVGEIVDPGSGCR